MGIQFPDHTSGRILSGTVPKYRQLLQILRNQIVSGEISPGAQLPTEDALIEQYGISRGTVRKAIDQLEAEKLIRKEHGVGSFVLVEHHNAVPFYFSEEFLIQKYGKDRVTSEDLEKKVLPASIELAERLRIQPGEPVIHIERRQLLDGAPVCYTVRDVPEALCPSVMNMNLGNQSIHEVLVFVSEIPLLRAEMEIEARLMDAAEASLLDVKTSAPVLAVQRMTYTAPNRPAVWYRALFRSQYVLDVRVGE
jgi:GntR family transcriptional regulator